MNEKHINEIFNKFNMIYKIDNYILSEENIYELEGEIPVLIKVDLGDENLFVFSSLIQNISKSNLIITKNFDQESLKARVDEVLKEKEIKIIIDLFIHDEDEEVIIETDKRLKNIKWKELFIMNKLRKTIEIDKIEKGTCIIKIGINKNKLEKSIKQNNPSYITSTVQLITYANEIIKKNYKKTI